MSVLIKKMKMPKDCEKCDFAEWYNGTIYCHCIHYATVISDMEHLLSLCPLVEVPTPHGRLIDASQFEVFGYDVIEGSFDDGVAFALNRIDDAPTVIEEEE